MCNIYKKISSWFHCSVNSAFRYIKTIRSKWFSFFVIGLTTFVYSDFFSNWYKLKSGKFLEIIGTEFILVGTLWGFLGVVLDQDEANKLKSIQDKLDNNIDNQKNALKEVLGAILVASNFAYQGAVIIVFGTLLLLVKMHYLSE